MTTGYPPKKHIDLIVLACHALGMESPIVHYRIVGDRVELWDSNGRHGVYIPGAPGKSIYDEIPAPSKPVSRKKKSK